VFGYFYISFIEKEYFSKSSLPMKQKTIIYITVVLTAICLISGASSCINVKTNQQYNNCSIIPKPVSVQQTEGEFFLGSSTTLMYDTSFSSVTETMTLFNSFLERNYDNIKLQRYKPGKRGNTIEIFHDYTLSDPEGYTLKVEPDSIQIGAIDDRGIFYAFQTLMQLIYPSQSVKRGEIPIPCVSIIDHPEYGWRGLHLDVSRHFFPKEFIFKLLDAMALHKLNTFHWHLTDDQGWRLEIKKYPELTNTGAWRNETLIGHGSETPWRYDGVRYGGFYTQQDVKEIIEYARKLHINILPEIEMPGHAVAALRAYPELSCTGGPITAFNRWGVSEDVFCAGKEETFDFITGVLAEVMELFPYEYIHIGGDECPKKRWKVCSMCQKRIEENNLKDENDLQSYFVKRVEAVVSSKGKKIIGWDEILEGGFSENAAVMSWRGAEGGIEAANMGHDVVMTPHSFVYLDYYQSAYNEPLAIGGMLDMKKVYSLQIMPEEIEDNKKKHIIGAQANVWTEYMPDSKHVEYMIFPRIAAVSEVLWSTLENRDFNDFTHRMNEQYARYDAMHINYRIPYPSGYYPVNITKNDSVVVTLDNGVNRSRIYYTLDGTNPDEQSSLYTNPIMLDLNKEKHLKSVTVMPSGRRSAIMSGLFRKVLMKNPAKYKNLEKGLVFKLYNGSFTSAKELNGKPYSNGVIPTITIPEIAPDSTFGLEFVGIIEIKKDDIYTFYINSDDGAVLLIDNEIIVDGDIEHHGIINSGSAALMEGFHEICIRFFQNHYRKNLNVSYESKYLEKSSVSADVLFHSHIEEPLPH